MKAFRYDDFLYLTGAFIKFHVHNIPDLLTVSDIDNFFFLKT